MLRRAVWLLFCAFAALAAFVTVRSIGFVGKPFAGFLMSPNGMVSLFAADDWTGVVAGLDAWEVIREVDGRPVTRSAEVLEIVRRRPPGTVFRYRVLGRDGERSVEVPSMLFRTSDFLGEELPFLVTAVAFALAGLLIYVTRPGWANFGFAVFGMAIGAALLRADFFIEAALGAYLLQWMLPLVAAALFHLGLVFPDRPRILRRHPLLLVTPYAVSFGLGALRAAWLFRAPELWVALDKVAFAYTGIASLFLVGMFLYWARRASEQDARERARVVLWGLLPAVLVAASGTGIRWLSGSRAAMSIVPLFAAWVWIGFLATAAVKRNIFDFEIFARRTVTYAILWAVTLGTYGLGLAAAYVLLREIGYSYRASLPLLAVFFAIPLIPGLVPAVQRQIEARLFPLQARLVEVVGRLSADLSTLMESRDVSRKLRETLLEDVGVRPVALYVAADGGLSPAESAPAVPEAAFDSLRPRIERGDAISIFELGERAFEPAARWMNGHGFTLLLPLVARSRLEGVLALGEAPGGHVFDSEDVDRLASLANRLAISLANASAYELLRNLEARSREENQALREELELHPGFPEILGRSPKMAAVFRSIEQVAATDTTVLLGGETGTGKELVARAIHIRSARRDGPLVKVNCAAIPSGLIESELFGHERGAFTDATARRRGRFELADGGTIFLDEIGEIPLPVQAKLLRVVQEREFERVGGRETLRANVRVLAATNRDLRAEVAAGRFREDLFFRLNV
ncbi:MAG: sigma 54-interacting transcriptional regulator, partial [Candidatus Binatia bacterium]